jgi:hypothetical protein
MLLDDRRGGTHLLGRSPLETFTGRIRLRNKGGAKPTVVITSPLELAEWTPQLMAVQCSRRSQVFRTAGATDSKLKLYGSIAVGPNAFGMADEIVGAVEAETGILPEASNERLISTDQAFGGRMAMFAILQVRRVEKGRLNGHDKIRPVEPFGGTRTLPRLWGTARIVEERHELVTRYSRHLLYRGRACA